MAYGYYRSITVNHLLCGTANSTDYPVLVSITGSSSLKLVGSGGRINNTGTQVGGAGGTIPFDLVFSTDIAGASKLAWEVEYYNSATGDLIAWVKVPTLSVTVDTVFYMTYGDPGVVTQQNTGSFSPANVWDSNFLAVWHLGRSNLKESTAAGLDLTNSGATAVAGKIDQGVSIAAGQYMEQASATALQFNYNSVLTISAWVKLTRNQNECFIGNVDPTNGSRGWEFGQLYSSSVHSLQFYLINTWSTKALQAQSSQGNPDLGTTAMRFATLTYTGSGGAAGTRFYIDGVNSNPQTSNDNLASQTTTNTKQTRIGARTDGSSSFAGNLDEIRISNVVRSTSWIKADYNNQNDPGNVGSPGFLTFGSEVSTGPSTLTLSPASRALTFTPATPAIVVPGSGYRYSRQLTSDHTKVAANLTNFPVAVTATSPSLKSAANGGKILNTVTQSGGAAITIPADLVFTSDSAGTAKYPWEIESWDAVNGVLIAWVKLPSISSTVDTPFYMSWGNAAVTSQQNTGSFSPSNVWDANYKGVWHLPNGTSLTLADSTAASNGMTNTGVSATSGKLGGGLLATGSNSYASVSASAITGFPFTLEVWAKPTGVPASGLFQSMLEISEFTTSQFFGLFWFETELRMYGFDAGGNNLRAVTGVAPTDSNLHHIVGVFTDSATFALYLDGNFLAVKDVFLVGNGLPAISPGLNRTSLAADLRGNISQNFFNGTVDEARLSNVIRTASWILTSYNSQNAPGNIGTPGFLTFGAEVDAGPAVTTLSPVARALTLSPATPILKSTVRLAPTTKVLAIAPATPTLRSTIRLSPAASVLAVTPATPTLKSTVRLQPATKALAIAPATPTLKSTVRLAPTTKVLAIAPATPTLRATLRPATRALTFLAGTPTVFVSSSNALHPASRALTLTAGTPVLRTITVLHPATRALTLTLEVPALRATTRPGSAALNLTRYTPTVRITTAGLRTQPMATIV